MLAESLPACREKLSNTSGAPDVLRYASLLFSCAETAIRDKESSLAADWAKKALEVYHRASCLDSEWHIRVLLGRAGEAAPARSALNRLKSQWAAEDYERYLARPDIRRLSRELKYMEGSKQ